MNRGDVRALAREMQIKCVEGGEGAKDENEPAPGEFSQDDVSDGIYFEPQGKRGRGRFSVCPFECGGKGGEGRELCAWVRELMKRVGSGAVHVITIKL